MLRYSVERNLLSIQVRHKLRIDIKQRLIKDQFMIKPYRVADWVSLTSARKT